MFGSYEICSQSKGYFYLESGHGKLVYNDVSGLHVTSEKIPYEGTLVISQIDFSVPHLLEKALTIGGRTHRPTDFVELKYESDLHSSVSFLLKEHSHSFGSRVAGTPVRTKLINLARMCPEARIVVDLLDVPLVSSSFADEVFGKLFLELGPMTFMQRFELKNSFPTVKQLIDKAILQRMSSGT